MKEMIKNLYIKNTVADSKREGIYVYVWLIHFAVLYKLTQHCKATILQLTLINKKNSHWSTNVLDSNSNAVKGKISDLQDCQKEQPRTQKRQQIGRTRYGPGVRWCIWWWETRPVFLYCFHFLSKIKGEVFSPGEGNGNPLRYSCLENPMDRGAWRATVHGVAKSQTRLGDFTFTFTFIQLRWRRMC